MRRIGPAVLELEVARLIAERQVGWQVAVEAR